MSWDRVEDVPSRPGSGRFHVPSTGGYAGHAAAKSTTALVVWRCSGCRKFAVTGAGGDPGKCLFRGCRFFGGR